MGNRREKQGSEVSQLSQQTEERKAKAPAIGFINESASNKCRHSLALKYTSRSWGRLPVLRVTVETTDHPCQLYNCHSAKYSLRKRTAEPIPRIKTFKVISDPLPPH